jgi:exodeoxyribonuclease VII small subunit
MRKKDPGAAEPSFEKALDELESIVAKMEDGGLTLEQSLAAHKRGLELAKQCRERLAAAQQQVRVLEGEALKPLGNDVLRPAAGAADDGDRG